LTSTALDILDGQWHFVVYTYTGILVANNGSLYVDGNLVANNSVTAPAGDSPDVWIGGAPDYYNRFLAGSIAHAAVFTYAVDASDVDALYTSQASLSPVTLSIATNGLGGVVVTWSPAIGTLLQSTNMLGPWTTNSAAVSPYTAPASGTAEFYKIQTYP
jgi:hypothetical protein